MARQTSNQVWIDRYIRDELTTNEMADFEVALMESSAMQQDLETALALRETLLIESGQEPAHAAPAAVPPSGFGHWQRLAMAATVVLAVFSTLMFWKVSNDSAVLQHQVDLLSQPLNNVLTVPVNIMRSADNRMPDVTVLKPQGRSAMLLDIELAPVSRGQESLDFALVDETGTAVTTWTSAPTANGHAKVLLNSEQVPAARLWLQISSSDGQPLERRLLEFRQRDNS